MFDLCPICNSVLNTIDTTHRTTKFCSNNCYEFIENEVGPDLTLFTCVIFGKIFSCFDIDKVYKIEEFNNSVLKEINFWSENERYLCKILSS